MHLLRPTSGLLGSFLASVTESEETYPSPGCRVVAIKLCNPITSPLRSRSTISLPETGHHSSVAQVHLNLCSGVTSRYLCRHQSSKPPLPGRSPHSLAPLPSRSPSPSQPTNQPSSSCPPSKHRPSFFSSHTPVAIPRAASSTVQPVQQLASAPKTKAASIVDT